MGLHRSEKMKLASLLLSSLVFADDDERKSRHCKTTPTECGQCLNMGPRTVDFCGFVERWLLLGYKDDRCCETKHPESCADCHDLGAKCIAIHNQEKQCKKFGYKQGAECPEACSNKVPTKCKDCEEAGDKCIADGGFEKVCQKLNYGQFIKGKCPVVCPEHDVEKLTCADCKALSDVCMDQL